MNSETLTKQDLLDTIESLQDRLDDAEIRLGLASTRREDFRTRIQTLENVNGEMHDQLNDLEARIDTLETDVGARQREKRSKHGRVVQHAHNVKGSRPGQVVTPKEAAAAANCSERHAYQLVEDMADEYGFCELQREPHKAVRVSFQKHNLDAALRIVQGKSRNGGD